MLSVNPNLKMQMWASGIAGAAAICNQLAFLHIITNGNQKRLTMCIQGGKLFAVLSAVIDN